MILAFVAALSAFSADSSQDEAVIHKLETCLQEAWNRHDAQALANFFTEDADCVNVVGWWWKERPQIEKKVAAPRIHVLGQHSHQLLKSRLER